MQLVPSKETIHASQILFVRLEQIQILVWFFFPKFKLTNKMGKAAQKPPEATIYKRQVELKKVSFYSKIGIMTYTK